MRAKAPPFDDRPDPDRGQTTLDFAVGMSIFLIAVAGVISFTPSLLEPFEGSGTEDTIVANRVASQLVEGTLAEPDKPFVLDKACTAAFFAPENADGNPDNDRDLNDTNDGQLDPGSRDPDPARHDVSGDPLWTDSDCNFDLDYLHERLGMSGLADDGSIDRSQSPGLQIEIHGDADDDGDTGILCYEAPGGSDPDPPLGTSRPIVESEGSPWDRGDLCDASGGDYDIPFQVGGHPPEDTGSVVAARRIATIDGIRATVEVRVW